MKDIILIFAFISITINSYGQTNKSLLDGKFYSTIQGFLDNAKGIKINNDKKILNQQFTTDTIRVVLKNDGTVWVNEYFDIEWEINNKNTYFFTNVDDENKKLVRFELGFSFDYSNHYYVKDESKGELNRTKARVKFYILRKDLDEFSKFLENYKIRPVY